MAKKTIKNDLKPYLLAFDRAVAEPQSEGWWRSQLRRVLFK